MLNRRGDVEVMATGARRNTEVFGCVDPVSPICVVGGWFQDVRLALQRYETPAERRRRSEFKRLCCTERIQKKLIVQIFTVTW